MLSSGQNWQPSVLERVIRPLKSSTEVVLVSTDAGNAFIKGIGNPAGDGSLASELVAAELAVWFGLPIPDFAIVTMSDLPVQMISGAMMSPGPAFASRAVEGTPALGDVDAFLARTSNRADVGKLVVFDTWLRNGDRCPPPDALDPSPRWDNLFFRRDGRKYELMALDHTHCFTEGPLEDEIADAEIVQDPRVYGLFPGFQAFMNEQSVRAATDRLRLIDAASVSEIVGSVPAPWGPSAGARSAWVDAIVGRAKFVADTLPDRLFDQGQLRL